jgi:hypothetical protein
MKKRYTSADKIGRAWLDREISCECIAGRTGGYKIIADPNTIWNGEKTQVLVRRNDKLNLVVALRRGTVSLGKSALACIQKATEIPAVYRWNYANRESTRVCVSPRVVPTPFVLVNNLDDPTLSSCDLEHLQPLVLSGCVQHFKSLLRSYKNLDPSHYKYKYTEDQWAVERDILKAVGLDVPKEIEDKKLVAIATRRLRSGKYHE